MVVRFVNKETGEIREQTVFMGNFPMMTEQGTFIINGTERVIVTQLVRSPGAYLMEAKDATKQVFTANLMPSRGSWLELEIDKKGAVYARIDRKRKLPITTLLRALPKEDPSTGFEIDTSSNEAILALFDNSVYIANTLEKDATTREEEAVIEVFKKQRPGEPPTLENARNLLRGLFFDPKRYDLTKVGRYKLNQRLEVDVPDDVRVLTTQDIVALVRKLVDLPKHLGVPEDSKDYAADAIGLSRDPIRKELDEYEHFGNRRLRTVGELIQEAFRVGLYRMERVVRERMTTEDVDTITPQTIINVRPVQAALKEFFGSSQLSQFMDQTNSLAGLTHRRRLSALGAGGLTRERAPIEVRDVHVTHYGRMCPIETPEGPNIGLIGSLASMAMVSEFGFVQTPYRVVKGGKVTDEIVYLDASEEEKFTIAQANEPIDSKTGKFVNDHVLCRAGAGEYVSAEPKGIQYMDVNPAQIVSVATALIPFLEHNDANRALMGANMQRQAVPLLITDPPLVGTGLEYRAAVDTGDVVLARRAGTVVDVDAEQIVVETKDGKDEYELVKFMRSNQGTLIHQKAIVNLGQKVAESEVLADGSSTSNGELALGRNLLVAFMPFEGFNFEDAIVVTERLVKDDMLSSIHIHEYEIDARSTKLGDEEITRDIPNRSEESPRGPRRSRRRADRRRGRLGRPAGRQGHAEGRDRADRRGEADPRDLQGEGARGPRHVAQGSARRGRQGHRRQDVLPVRGRRPLAGGQRARARVRREEAQGGRGRQARRTARQQGRDREDRARGGHAVPRGRDAGRRGVEPARRPEPDEHRPGARDASRLGGVPRRLRRRKRRRRPTPVATRRSSTVPPRQSRRGARRVDAAEPGLADRLQGRREAAAAAGAAPARCGSSTAAPASPSTRTSPSASCTSSSCSTSWTTRSTRAPRARTPSSRSSRSAARPSSAASASARWRCWALEAYGAAYTLQEMLTIKSDDTVGRVKAYEAIVKGENIAEPSIPESFKVLLKEMQSLALDVQVLSEEGGEVEVREEEDELLRAAEELGIDLSPGLAASRRPTAHGRGARGGPGTGRRDR